MPLQLPTPNKPAPVATQLRITKFRCSVNPSMVHVEYLREDADGATIDRGSAEFSGEEIEAVDPDGSVRDLIKDTLYQLLAARGAG